MYPSNCKQLEVNNYVQVFHAKKPLKKCNLTLIYTTAYILFGNRHRCANDDPALCFFKLREAPYKELCSLKTGFLCSLKCPCVRPSVCPHLLVWDITLKLPKISTTKIVGRQISWSRSAVQKNRYSALPNFGVIALCLFYTLNIVLDITLKLGSYQLQTL